MKVHPPSISPSCSSTNTEFKRNQPSIFFFFFDQKIIPWRQDLFRQEARTSFFFLLWTQQRNQGTSWSTCLPNDEGGRGESAPLHPLPLLPRTLPKEHQSRHCCGTVGSFELSVQEEGARRWMAHRMKPPFSQPCGNVPPGLNNYSGTRGEGTAESWESIPWSSVSWSCWQGNVAHLLNIYSTFHFNPIIY